MHRTSRNAFTIIEVAIIIIVAALLIGGIYTAKKFLTDNEVKSLIMQIKKYDAAINSFTQKYHALPGDITGTATYGITTQNTDGNGDNVITDRIQKNLMANGEISTFWMHLSKSKMLDENYDGGEDLTAKTSTTFPQSKIGEKSGIVVFGAEGKTFYQIGFDFADTDRLYTSNRTLKANEAFLFDTKVDDGNPQKGRVVAAGSNSLNVLQNEDCVKFNSYDRSRETPFCQLRIEVK